MATLDRPRIEYRTPVDLVKDVRRGLLRIPPFQRGFKWESSDVIALFDSLLRGFPVGNLLFWKKPAPAGHIRVGPLEIEAPELDSAYWVVDGQQRVTSLVGALAAAEQATDPRFRIHLDLEEGQFHSLGARQQAPRQWLPVSRLVDTSVLLAWMRHNSEWLEDSHIEIADAAAKAIREYQIPTYVVAADDENALRQIFDRLNSTGKPLTRAEVFHALHSGLAGDEPNDLRAIGGAPAHLGFGSFEERLALRCVLAFRGGDIFREDFHDEFSSDADRKETFREVGTTLRVVVGFLQREAGIPHSRLLPYSHVVPVLVRFFRLHGEPSGRVAELLRRWVWRDAVAGLTAKSTSVAAVRQAVTAAGNPDTYGAARDLLSLAPRQPSFVPDLTRVHMNHAAAKINVLGLLSAGPRDLSTGEPFDLTTSYEGGNITREIVARRDVPLAQSFANRVILPTSPARPVRVALVEASPDVAATHLVDREAQQLLAAEDFEGFLQRRAALVKAAIGRHIDAMAEWGARDGRSIADMIRSAA